MKKITLLWLPLLLLLSQAWALDNSEVVGTWNCKPDMENATGFQLNLFEKNDRLFGTYTTEHQQHTLLYVHILEDRLRFQIETKGLKIKFKASVEGNRIRGTISTEDDSIGFTGIKEDPEQPEDKK